MASCSSLLSEEQVLCSICLEMFNQPISIACGHNFCKVCISSYWDTNDLCQCPLCKHNFHRRPALHVNTTLRDLVENVKKMKVRDEDKSPAGPGEVSCDVCAGTKLKATKSCLVCQTSYCETHLEPHLRKTTLKKHKLIHAVENLEDRMCKKHNRLLEFFCRKDQMCLCLMFIFSVYCLLYTNTDHTAHNAVPLEERECGQSQRQSQSQAEIGKMMRDIDQMMKTRWMKVQEIKLSVETRKRNAEREISDSVEDFTALVLSIQRSQSEIIQVIEEKQKAAEKQAEGFIKDLEQEITELQRRSSELEMLSHHLHLFQTFPSLNTPPHTKDWSQISVQSDPGVMSQLEEMLSTWIGKLHGDKLKRIQQRYAVNVTLDPDTAHRKLILSDDGTQVRHGGTWKNLPDNPGNLPDNPGKFDTGVCVLGKQSFSSGRFYYEVQVEGKYNWDLGVVRESINRNGEFTLGPMNGYWHLCLRNGYNYWARADTYVRLYLTEKPQKVGVFVDYEEGRVSFYNVETKSHIYSFTGCTFTEKLYPFLSPGDNDGLPLIITSNWSRTHPPASSPPPSPGTTSPLSSEIST